MKKGLTELVFILDRSGSMRGLEADTIGGFNALLEKQKKEEGEALVSVVLFDDRMEVLYDRQDIRKVEPMNDSQYYVRGCTALLDALGGAIHHIGNVHKYARREDVPEKTLFIIKRLPPLRKRRGQADGRAPEGDISLGIPVPWRQYGCNQGCQEIRDPGKPRCEL